MVFIADVVFNADDYAMEFAPFYGTIQFLRPGYCFFGKYFNEGIERGGCFDAGKKMSYRLLTGGTTVM